QAPVLYQTAANGSRQLVAGGYTVRADGTVGFHVDAPYDPSRELVLDPTLSLSSYLGGNSSDNGNAIAVDPSGNIYLVGSTSSTNFTTVNAYDSTLGGSGDAFLTKLSPTGTILYSTYLGGVNQTLSDQALALAVDAAGCAYLSGQAISTDFP